MSGKTEQVQTTGKNLFDDSKNEKGYYTGGLGTVSGLVKTNGWSWSSPLNAIENTTLSVSVVTKIKSRFQIILADDSNTVLYVNTKYSASSAEYTHSFNAVEGTTKILISVYEETSPEGVTIMLNEGVVSIPHEPYTDRKPSPSPDYPQPIEVTPQGVITVDFTDGTKHQTVELNCPREFTKWDRLEKIDGVWNWVFGSRKETFEDASVKNMIDVSDKNTRQFTVRHETDIKDAWSNAYVLSNNFIGVSGNKSYTQSAPYDFYVAYHNKDIVFSSKKLDGIFETKETFQEWLQSSGTYILHKSDEKEFIPLSQSEQDKLNALTMYAPNTEITNDGGCNMELTYTVDTKAYVDAKIAPIVKTILETQKALL